MCNPGISPSKTDEQLASDYRRHVQACRSVRAELEERGYRLKATRDGNVVHVYSGKDPAIFEFIKEVQI